jgi:hypothetical protein
MISAPVRAPRRVQSAAERQAVYWDVTDRDEAAAPARRGCRALDIDPGAGPCGKGFQLGYIERHHAGVKTGANRNKITDARHLLCLCRHHHGTWAPTHSRLILEWLARVEDAREKVDP